MSPPTVPRARAWIDSDSCHHVIRRRHWHARDEGEGGGDLASVSWVSCASVVRCLGAVARDGGGDVRVGGGDGDDARGWDDDRARGGAGASRESSIDVRGAWGGNERGGNVRGRDGCVVVPDADRRRTSGWIGGDERVHHVARIGGHGTRVGGRGDADRDAETREGAVDLSHGEDGAGDAEWGVRKKVEFLILLALILFGEQVWIQ